MILYVMRHGPAEDRAASGRDADRPLSRAGRDVVAGVAKRLHASRSTPLSRILSSPALRAIETATIVRDASAQPHRGLEIEVEDALAPDESPPFQVVASLLGVGVDAMIVGHQPWVEHLVRSLAEDHSSLRSIRTATVVALASMEGSWHLQAVVEPG